MTGKPQPKISAARAAELRARGKLIREQISQDKEQVQQDAQEVIAAAVKSGQMTKVSMLFKGVEDSQFVAAIDAYAKEHGLQSRAQVGRVALAKLLGLELATPKWGWPTGKSRTEDPAPVTVKKPRNSRVS